MAYRLPQSSKYLILKESLAQGGPKYHDAVLAERPLPALKEGEVLVKIGAAAFNHREVWIRKGLYPRIVMGSTLGADGAGTVVAAWDANDPLLYKRVFLTPMRGWESHPDAPESNSFSILGGGNLQGTFAEYVVVERDQVILTPQHVTDVQMAAWPLAGLTAWRAAIIYGRVKAGDNVLITGIGGGVALIALQICLAKGATVYVTSGNDEKVRKAIVIGAKGGANYKDADWPAEIAAQLKKENAVLDSVIDSGGGDIMGQTGRYLKAGGRVVCYGMTANPKITLTMREVMRNQQLIGSMMGSHQDLIDATKFLEEHRIVPVVSHILDGLESAEEGFEMMRRGDQFGKIVIKVSQEEDSSKAKY